MKFLKDKSKLAVPQSIMKSNKLQPFSESIMRINENKLKHHLQEIKTHVKNSYQITQKVQSKKDNQKQKEKKKDQSKKQMIYKEDGKTTSNFIKNKAKSPSISQFSTAFPKGSHLKSPKNNLPSKVSSFKTFQDEDGCFFQSKLLKQQKKQSTNITNLDVEALLLSEKISKSKLQELNSQLTTLQTKLKDQQQKTFKLKQQNQNLIKKLQKMQQLSQQNKKMLRQRIQSFNKEGQNMRKMKNEIIDLEKIILTLKQENQLLKKEVQQIKNSKEQLKIKQNFIKISEGHTLNINEKSYLSYGQLPLYTIIKEQMNENNNFYIEPKAQDNYFQIQQNDIQCKQIIKIVNNTNTNDSILSALMKDINQNPNLEYIEAQVQTDQMLQNYRDDSNYVEDSLQKLKQKQGKNLQNQNNKKLIDLKQSYQKSLKDVQERFQFVIIKNYQKISQQQEQIFNLWQKLYQVSQIKNSQIKNSEIQFKQIQLQQKYQQPSLLIYNPNEVIQFLSGKILSPLQYRQKIQQMHTYISKLEQKLQNLQKKWKIVISQNQVKLLPSIIKSQTKSQQDQNKQDIYFKHKQPEQQQQKQESRFYKFEIIVSTKQKYQQIKKIFKVQQQIQKDNIKNTLQQNEQLEESFLLQQIDQNEDKNQKKILIEKIQNSNDQSSIII